MKLYHLHLERDWFVSAPEDMEEEQIIEEVYPDFVDFSLRDVVRIRYWGNANDFALTPDYVVERNVKSSAD